MVEDLRDTFSHDDLFQSEDQKTYFLRSDNSFRGIYNISALDYLIRMEERTQMKKNAVVLKDLFSKHLNMIQCAFIYSVLGKNWEKGRRILSLKFRDYDGDKFKDYFVAHVDEIKERINILLEYCSEATSSNRKSIVDEFISIPYNLATRNEIIEVYEMVKNGEMKGYPYRFFHPENERVPRILTKYLVDDILNLHHNEGTLKNLTRADFYEYNLGWMLEQYFGGNVKKALRHTYTEHEFPELYKTRYSSDDILREVFISLNQPKKGANHALNQTG